MNEENRWRCIIELYIIVLFWSKRKDKKKKKKKHLRAGLSHTLQVTCSPLSRDLIRTNLIFL